MIFIIVWRNIWRKKTRSLTIVFAVMLGIWAGLFMVAVMNGMILQQQDDSINHVYSHIQIHNAGFLANNEVKYTIPDANKALDVLEKNPQIKAVSMRTIVFGMAASPAAANGAKITGVIPSNESRLTNMKAFLKEGTYFADNKKNSVVIGRKLATKLKVKLHSKIVLTFSDKEGNILSGAFRVTGIYKTSNSQTDGINIYVNANDLNALLGADSGYHEMAMMLNDDRQLDTVESILKTQFPSLNIQSWKELSPESALMSGMTDYVLEILMSIMMLGLAFAIVNTMLMTVMERTRELGMLMAIGLNKRRTFSMLMYETIVLSFLGCPIGMGLAWLTVWYCSGHGINLSAFAKGLENFGYPTIIYPTLRSISYVQVSVMVLITAFLAAIYPGLKAIKLKPAEAIRHI